MPLVELDCSYVSLVSGQYLHLELSCLVEMVTNAHVCGDRSEMPPSADQGDNQVSNPRKSLEQEYLDYETKVIIAG